MGTILGFETYAIQRLAKAPSIEEMREPIIDIFISQTLSSGGGGTGGLTSAQMQAAIQAALQADNVTGPDIQAIIAQVMDDKDISAEVVENTGTISDVDNDVVLNCSGFNKVASYSFGFDGTFAADQSMIIEVQARMATGGVWRPATISGPVTLGSGQDHNNMLAGSWAAREFRLVVIESSGTPLPTLNVEAIAMKEAGAL